METAKPFVNPLKGDMVVGLAFDLAQDWMLLLRKNRPTWMAGQLNGIGGKINFGESAEDAMTREFMEETGVPTEPHDWHLFHYEKRLDGPGLYFYAADLYGVAALARTLTDEEVVPIRLEHWKTGLYAKTPMLYNLGFLVPMGHTYLAYPHHRYTVAAPKPTVPVIA
jgi:8-oxo-dGTP diphosphatase